MPQPQIRVHNLPAAVAERDLAGSTVIVVDLLRASTTICQALASGASEVVPFLEVADALAAAAEVGRSTVVLGGERGGRPIDGFDLGNSPAEYTPGAVASRRVFFTTTNGTRALRHAKAAQRVVVGAIVNLSAVVASVRDSPRVDLLCAGTGGRETREDILAAGAIVNGLCLTEAKKWQVDEGAKFAMHEWQALLSAAHAAARTPSDELALELRDTPGGGNLLAIELAADLVTCAQIDTLDVVPEFDPETGRLYLP
jgi:2-phosphosulfolactate phosphatase